MVSGMPENWYSEIHLGKLYLCCSNALDISVIKYQNYPYD